MNEAVKTTKGKLLMMAIVLATMLAALAVTSKPAEAYTQATSGRPGGVTGYQMNGSHYNGCSGGFVCWRTQVVAEGPTVYRSPATTGNQTIQAVYDLYRWNGSSWVLERRKTHTQTLYAGYSNMRVPNYHLYTNSSQGYYKAQIHIAWSNSSGALGFRHLSYDHSGDYVCNTRFTCTAGPGWIYLR